MSMPPIEIPTIFILQTEKYGFLEVGTLRFGGLNKLIAIYPDFTPTSPKEFCANFVMFVAKRKKGEEPIKAEFLTEEELERFSVQYLEYDKELFRRDKETIEIPRIASETEIEYFTRVVTDYLKTWSDKFSNGAVAAVLKASASLKILTSFGNILGNKPTTSDTIAKVYKSQPPPDVSPTKGRVEPVSVVMRNPLEGIDLSSIRSPTQETNVHLSNIAGQLETLPLKFAQDVSPQLTAIMEQLGQMVEQGDGTSKQNETMIRLNRGTLLATVVGLIIGAVSGYQAGKNSSPPPQASSSVAFKPSSTAVSQASAKSPIQKPVSSSHQKIPDGAKIRKESPEKK